MLLQRVGAPSFSLLHSMKLNQASKQNITRDIEIKNELSNLRRGGRVKCQEGLNSMCPFGKREVLFSIETWQRCIGSFKLVFQDS